MDAVHFAGHRCGPVITTATDVNGLPAPDVLARHEHLLVDDFQTLINVNSAIVGGECIDYYIDESLPNAAHLEQAAKAHIGEHGSVHVVSMEQLGETPCKMKVLKRILLA